MDEEQLRRSDDEKERGDLDNASKVKRKETIDRLKERERLEGLARILSTVDGRKLHWDIFARCHMFETSFTGNNTTFFNEGERNVALRLLADIMKVAPLSFIEMWKEGNKEPLE